MSSNYKASPLPLNSNRSSPFRRPSSPSSSSTIVGRPTTPPGRGAPSPMTSPSKLKHSFTASEQEEEQILEDFQTRPLPTRAQTEPPALRSQPQTSSPIMPRALPSPSKSSTPFSISSTARNPSRFNNSETPQTDVLSKLPPPLLHSIRESFSVLDSNSTGTINAASVVETMQSLGLQEQNVSQFFPYGQPQQLSLPQYLNQLANLLVGLSPQRELLNAFAAFDDDDSGQVDIAELRDALLHTAPEAGERPLNERDIDRAMEGFTGRRILGKNAVGIAGVRGLNNPGGNNKKNGEVFRYQEFVGNLTGGNATDGLNAQAFPSRSI